MSIYDNVENVTKWDFDALTEKFGIDENFSSYENNNNYDDFSSYDIY